MEMFYWSYVLLMEMFCWKFVSTFSMKDLKIIHLWEN
jgi:hypothetical protein